jgi:DNA replication ATP-dependent helicase Dna2
VLAPDRSVVLARVDHLHAGPRSQQEAALVADLIEEAVRRHRLPPAEIAVIAPFRAQVRVIRSALQKRAPGIGEGVLVDTVERVQGQERLAVFLSLAVGDPDCLDRSGKFLLSLNRLNVALSRARVKAVMVGSRSAFAALPQDAEGLRAASTLRRLLDMVAQVDMTPLYS